MATASGSSPTTPNHRSLGEPRFRYHSHRQRQRTNGKRELHRQRGFSPEADDAQAAIIERVRSFEEFDADNDPYGEHDFGSFDHDGRTIFWKSTATTRSSNGARLIRLIRPNISAHRPRECVGGLQGVLPRMEAGWPGNLSTLPVSLTLAPSIL